MKAGFGAATITPEPPVYLAGFGARTEPAQSVHDDLEASAAFLADGETSMCLIVCDLLGMTPDVSMPIREAVASALGVARANVVLACTHTHAGPSLIAGSEAIGWPTPAGYADFVRDRCVTAAVAAGDAAAETSLRFLRAPLPNGIAFNRRGGDYDGPTFSVLEAVGTGFIANFGIHPVLLGPDWLEVATDWIGPFRRELAALAGGTAIELTGALGDINPTPPSGKPGDTYAPWASPEQTADYGKRLARLVADALPGAGPVEGPLAVLREESIDVPVGGTAIAALHGAPRMHVELVEWSIGDVRLVSVPGEAFHALGREICAVRNDRVLLAGLAPWHGYLPHPYGDGYEEGVSYGPDAVAAIRRALVDAVKDVE
ncbi:MAG TPA: hypothetical protein VFA34_01360 [Actinomycetota bacterium]|jgi:hypothetical protein|nr:hypothetical protein [Actinomycetota bacterium]